MKETFRGLTSLRFFAALAVVCFHYSPNAQGFKLLPGVIQNWVRCGPIALEFFYVLSGFVLTHAYNSRPPNTRSMCRSFWLARVARLYPVYLLAFILFLPIAYEKYLHHPAFATDGTRTFVLGGILGLFALQAWTPLSQAWNGPSWSLSVEAFFYLIFPLTLLWVRRASSKKLITVLAVLWIGMLTLALLHLNKAISDAVWLAWVRYNPLFWSPMFLFGIATYRYSKAWQSLSGATASCIGAGALCAAAILCGCLPPAGSDLLINGASAPLIAIILLTFSHPTAIVARLAGLPILFEAGGASYIIYILQSPIWHSYRRVISLLSHSAADLPVRDWQFLVFLLLLISLSLMVQIVVERPAQRWLLARWSSRSPDTALMTRVTPSLGLDPPGLKLFPGGDFRVPDPSRVDPPAESLPAHERT